ncbi:hypothetical protein AMJ85_10085, partial [candidate division BRC1 bacterium SM23_51]
MRKLVRATVWLGCIALLARSGVCGEGPSQSPTPQDVLKTLRAGHPRLVALDSDIERVRQMIANDATARS